jgi:CRISPR-associated protein Csc3
MSSQQTARLDELIFDAVSDDGESESLDDQYVDLLAEYVEDIDPELMRLGWTLENAKSSQAPFYKYDQSMISHTRTGVFFLLRFIGDVLPDKWLVGRGEREDVLRDLVGMFVVHDVHKTRGETTFDSEFNISQEEIGAFVEKTGIDSFAPSLSVEDFHSVAVGLHKTDNAKHEMLSQRFLDLNPFLRLADGVASLSDPEAWVSQRQRKNFENAVSTAVTPHAHAVDGGGPLTSVINKAAAETFESYGYALLTIHESGCTYGIEDAEDSVGTLPAHPDEFLTRLYQNFLVELRKALPRYRNRSILAGAAEVVDGQGRYRISDLDVVCLPPRDLVRAIVEKGVTQADAPFDIPNYARRTIETLTEETDVSFDRSYRIEGIARLVHTVYETIVPALMRDDDAAATWEQNRMAGTLAVFGVSETMQRRIAALYTATEDDSPMASLSGWPYKYLIAHDLLTRGDYFTGESGGETIEAITSDLMSELADFTKWSSYRTETVGSIDEELRATVFNRLRFDGESLTAFGVPDAVEQYVGESKASCGLCDTPTTAPNVAQPPLVEADLRVEERSAKYRNIEVEHDGAVIDLQDTCYESHLCYSCQLDVELHAADTSWEDDGNRLHVAVRPEYAYTPLSGIIFSHIIDTYSSVGAERGADFARNVFVGANNDQAAYDAWMDAHAQNDFGRQMLSTLDRGFNFGAGYGGHTVSFPLPEGDTREALFTGAFAACVAASYSGLTAYISTHPVTQTPDTEQKELVRLSPTMKQIRPLFGDSSLPLHQMNGVLKATSAIRQLGQAAGNTHAPVDTYWSYKQDRSVPLVGSAMLQTAVQNGADPEQYAQQAVHLDSHAAESSSFDMGIVRDARLLGQHAYDLLDRPDDPDVVRAFLNDTIDIIVEQGSQLRTDDLRAEVSRTVQNHDDVDMLAFDAIDEFVNEYTHILVGEVFERQHGASTRTLEAIREPLGTGVWTHTVALNDGDDRSVVRSEGKSERPRPTR